MAERHNKCPVEGCNLDLESDGYHGAICPAHGPVARVPRWITAAAIAALAAVIWWLA